LFEFTLVFDLGTHLQWIRFLVKIFDVIAVL